MVAPCPGAAGTPLPDSLAITMPSRRHVWRRASCPENPRLLVMSLQRGGRSSGGPVDQHVGGRAFGRSAHVDASHILDLSKKPD